MAQETDLLLYGFAFMIVLAAAFYNLLYFKQVKNIRMKLGMFVPRPIYFVLWLGVWFPLIACSLLAVFILITVLV